MLKGEDGPLEAQQKSFVARPVIVDGLDLQDYTCGSSYLNDLHHHMPLVME